MSSWFGGPASTTHSHSHTKHHHSSQSQSHSRRSPSPKRYFVRDKEPRTHSPAASSTSRGFFWSRPSHSSSSSYYKRRPRDGYISRILHNIKRYLRDLIDYAKRHPLKVLMLVVMPLVTGGALHNVLRGMGVSLPAGLAGFMGGGRGGGGGFGGDGRDGGAGGGGVGLEQVVNIAKMFM